VGLGSLGSGAVDGVLALADGAKEGRSAAATGEFLAHPATRISAASMATPRSDVDAERAPSDLPISTLPRRFRPSVPGDD
jgi:anti-sigma factor ChrR (cupin superfamily)